MICRLRSVLLVRLLFSVKHIRLIFARGTNRFVELASWDVLELGVVAVVRIPDVGEVAFGVVGVDGRLVVLVGGGDAPAARIVAETRSEPRLCHPSQFVGVPSVATLQKTLPAATSTSASFPSYSG